MSLCVIAPYLAVVLCFTDAMFPVGMTPGNGNGLHFPQTPMSEMSLFSDLEFHSSTPWPSYAAAMDQQQSASSAPVGAGLAIATPTPSARTTKKSPGLFGSAGSSSRSNWAPEADGSTPMLFANMAPNSVDRKNAEVCSHILFFIFCNLSLFYLCVLHFKIYWTI